MIHLLEQNLVLTHPAVIGELACGFLKQRAAVLDYLQFLPLAQEATHEEVLMMIETRYLYGKCLNWVDVQLLAGAALSNAFLWTLDKPLSKAASFTTQQ